MSPPAQQRAESIGLRRKFESNVAPLNAARTARRAIPTFAAAIPTLVMKIQFSPRNLAGL
jgi:hypothetical protein